MSEIAPPNTIQEGRSSSVLISPKKNAYIKLNSNMNKQPIVLIMCGGKSLRLWPLSEYTSKNFIDVFGFSPLELAIKRFSKITDKKNIFLVANISEKRSILKIKGLKKDNIFFEPASRNTAAAITFALFNLLAKFSKDRTLIISPVDNLISNNKEFKLTLKRCVEFSRTGKIGLIGIKADKPTSQLGFIRAGKTLNAKVFKAVGFVEKPSLSKAKKLVKSGKYYYNAGMFIATLASFESECRKYYRHFSGFTKAYKSKQPSSKKLNQLYTKLTNIPFDKAVMEKTKLAFLVKSTFEWRDFGSWNTIHDILARNKDNNVLCGKAALVQCKNSLVYAKEGRRKILALGLKNIIFVVTPEHVLIADKSSLGNLKTALEDIS